MEMEPFKATWVKYGCTVLCNGWTDLRKRNVYNILVSSCKGTMFLRAINASTAGKVVTKEFIFCHMCYNYPRNRKHCASGTDNGSNRVSMGKMLQEEFPKIVWTPCASHSLNLMIENVGELETSLGRRDFIIGI